VVHGFLKNTKTIKTPKSYRLFPTFGYQKSVKSHKIFFGGKDFKEFLMKNSKTALPKKTL
jgi:hypothetical protein